MLCLAMQQSSTMNIGMSIENSQYEKGEPKIKSVQNY